MDRDWQILADEDGYIDREELQGAFLEAEAILTRLGGAISAVAARDEGEDGSYVTRGVLFRWSSFSPARKRQSQVQVEPEAELDELAAAA